MAYVLKLMIASAIALVASGLAINYTLGAVAHQGDIVLFVYLALICVVLPGLSWWAAMRLMRML